jgi:hypothetical protein
VIDPGFHFFHPGYELDPEETVQKIYSCLNKQQYKHIFEHVEQVTFEDDSIYRLRAHTASALKSNLSRFPGRISMTDRPQMATRSGEILNSTTSSGVITCLRTIWQEDMLSRVDALQKTEAAMQTHDIADA